MKVSEISPLQVRMPPDLRAWMKERAAQNDRSMNREIVRALEQFRAKETSEQKVAG